MLNKSSVTETTCLSSCPYFYQAELKRVYAQLEVLKTKVMRRDNPHISKRRGGRKPGHRKFSLQAFHAKHIAGAGSSHNTASNSAQQSHNIEAGHQIGDSIMNNNSDHRFNHSEQQLISIGTGSKLPVVVEHDGNESAEDKPTIAETSDSSCDRRIRVGGTSVGAAPINNRNQQTIANCQSDIPTAAAKQQQLSRQHIYQPTNNRHHNCGTGQRRSVILADPVSTSSANFYLDEDPFFLNDSQSSIHPEEEESANY